MSSPTAEQGGLVKESWQPLDMVERRVLGVLAEKSKTTPDAYPLSVNALVTGSNQKSNRDPLLNLEDYEIEDALVRCQKRGLVVRIQTSRVDRWKHMLYDVWHLSKVELSIIAELLLRGPQTEGDLRSRASRMDPIEDLDALRAALRPLVERKLVVYLTPEDRRGAMLTHGFHDPQELEALKQHAASGSLSQPAGGSARVGSLAEMQTEIAALQGSVNELRQTVTRLEEELRSLKQALE